MCACTHTHTHTHTIGVLVEKETTVGESRSENEIWAAVWHESALLRALLA
jgi:hypothetical protein